MLYAVAVSAIGLSGVGESAVGTSVGRRTVCCLLYAVCCLL